MAYECCVQLLANHEGLVKEPVMKVAAQKKCRGPYGARWGRW